MTPLVWLGGGLVAGIWLGRYWTGGDAAVGLLALAVLAGYGLARSLGWRAGLPVVLALALLLGLVRGGPELLTPSGDLARFHGQHATAVGRVAAMPEPVGARVRLTLAVDTVRTGIVEAEAHGTAIVWVGGQGNPVPGRSFPYVERGDRVAVSGILRAPEPFGGFDYPEHLASQDIGTVVSGTLEVEELGTGGALSARGLDRLRRRLADGIDRVLPQPAAAIAQAVGLGLRGSVPPTTSDQFQRSGTTHLLAISGLHVGVVMVLAVGLAAALFGRRHPAYLLLPLAAAWAYVLLAGLPPSAVRAGIMGSAVLVAMAVGRAPSPLTALGLATSVMLLLWRPEFLWHRSFQLSFTAMAGVLLLGLPLWDTFRVWLEARTRPGLARTVLRWLAAAVITSAGAVAGSLPLVAFNFGVVPVWGIPATLLVLPLLPLLIVGGLTSGALAALWTPLGWLTGWVPAIVGWYVAAVAGLAASMPLATVDVGRVEPAAVWGYYVGLAAVVGYLHRRQWWPQARHLLSAVWQGPGNGRQATLALLVLVMAVAVPWSIAADRSDSLLRIHFLDVGQGDAAVVTTPSGAVVLVDGGRDPRVTLPLLDGLLGRRSVDLAIVSHPHEDHIAGLMALARRGSIAQALVPPVVPGEDDAWRRELEQLGVPVDEAAAGMVVDLGGGVFIEVLHPPQPLMAGTSSDVDNNGTVVRLRYHAASALFVGDLFVEGELALLDVGADLDADVLKVGHHGSRTSSAEAFLDAVSPLLAVVSVSGSNSLGHPSAEVVQRLVSRVGEQGLLLTSVHGTVEAATDGESWWLATRR